MNDFTFKMILLSSYNIPIVFKKIIKMFLFIFLFFYYYYYYFEFVINVYDLDKHTNTVINTKYLH